VSGSKLQRQQFVREVQATLVLHLMPNHAVFPNPNPVFYFLTFHFLKLTKQLWCACITKRKVKKKRSKKTVKVVTIERNSGAQDKRREN